MLPPKVTPSAGSKLKRPTFHSSRTSLAGDTSNSSSPVSTGAKTSRAGELGAKTCCHRSYLDPQRYSESPQCTGEAGAIPAGARGHCCGLAAQGFAACCSLGSGSVLVLNPRFQGWLEAAAVVLGIWVPGLGSNPPPPAADGSLGYPCRS